MKPDLKKLIITNLPYLLFVWLFGKMGEAWRLAAGADASQKMLHFMDSLAAAFANGLPSFHPFDLCIGIAGAVLVRLTVYLKGKNAKPNIFRFILYGCRETYQLTGIFRGTPWTAAFRLVRLNFSGRHTSPSAISYFFSLFSSFFLYDFCVIEPYCVVRPRHQQESENGYPHKGNERKAHRHRSPLRLYERPRQQGFLDN